MKMIGYLNFDDPSLNGISNVDNPTNELNVYIVPPKYMTGTIELNCVSSFKPFIFTETIDGSVIVIPDYLYDGDGTMIMTLSCEDVPSVVAITFNCKEFTETDNIYCRLKDDNDYEFYLGEESFDLDNVLFWDGEE